MEMFGFGGRLFLSRCSQLLMYVNISFGAKEKSLRGVRIDGTRWNWPYFTNHYNNVQMPCNHQTFSAHPTRKPTVVLQFFEPANHNFFTAPVRTGSPLIRVRCF